MLSKYLFNLYWYLMKLLIYIYTTWFKFNFNVNYKYNFYKIYLIKNSKIIKKLHNINRDYTPIDIDYIVYKQDTNNKLLLKLFNNIDICSLDQKSLKPCTFFFLSVILKIGVMNYNITNILNNKENYYYIIDAKLFTYSFMNWLVLYHLKIPINIFNNSSIYSIEILDNTANEIILNNNQYILLKNNSYEILDINK